MHAEGGTGPEHAVTVCRSKSIFGPYENNKCNPIITHRHLGKDYPVKYVGHADMIETPSGEWYMVMLAVRPLEGYTTMGRETFLAKVVWENGWPVVNPGVGILTEQVEIELPEWNPAGDAVFDGRGNCVPGSSSTYE
ncbi:non-reducing end alpha-L-arabinofuranosidase BoGH43B [Lachnospiraceae bacterium]|nr:non-reducing end alpha-L-arabinofuranosidase BoGH43B [Lachnospiraceae bacterium]